MYRTPAAISLLTALLLAVALGGCLGSLGGDEQPVRYFSAAVAPGSMSARVESDASLRMRRITAAEHLRDRVVWRVSDVEYGFYEQVRWTELPVSWLEQALARELFQARGLQRTELVGSPALDVYLTAFEEVLAPEHEARVELVLRLYDRSGAALVERTLERRESIDGGDPALTAAAASRALGVLVRDTAAIVVESLAGPSTE